MLLFLDVSFVLFDQMYDFYYLCNSFYIYLRVFICITKVFIFYFILNDIFGPSYLQMKVENHEVLEIGCG